MDLRCKFGVDCMLPARYKAVYMRYSKNKHSKNSELRELKCFRIHSLLHVMVAFSTGRRAFKLCTCR